jgi:glycine cleavage system transcriptional repressor
MRKHLVVTLTGPDRVGFVEQITNLILKFDGNVESSRMARLGGEFAVLMMVSTEERHFEGMRESLRDLRDTGLKVTTRETERGHSAKYMGWLPYRVEVKGADHEGIIHEITRHLAQQGINIETMDTGMVHAPMRARPSLPCTPLCWPRPACPLWNGGPIWCKPATILMSISK